MCSPFGSKGNGDGKCKVVPVLNQLSTMPVGGTHIFLFTAVSDTSFASINIF
jgi:hypothetical protein